MNKTNYVYIIKAGNNFKIGMSHSPRKRLMDLQVANPNKLKLFHEEPMLNRKEAFRIEKIIHRIFRKYKIQGEWFSGIKLDDIINKIKDVKNNTYQRADKIRPIMAEQIRETVGSQKLIDFVKQAKEINNECCFVVEYLADKVYPFNCMYAVTKPKYNYKLRKADLSKVKHLGHINKHNTVFREYEEWDATGRPLVYIPIELLIIE